MSEFEVLQEQEIDVKELESFLSSLFQDEDDDDTQDYTNWPMEGIKDPSKNDVLYGRGGG